MIFDRTRIEHVSGVNETAARSKLFLLAGAKRDRREHEAVWLVVRRGQQREAFSAKRGFRTSL